jgi:CHAD domain-containing protein
MQDYVKRKTAELLAKFAAEVDRAAEDNDPDAIHDLRVAIRRLSRCLRAFARFYPGRSWKKLRAQLSDMLHAAGAVRDCDIALELMAKAGFGPRAALAIQLRKEREQAHRKFVDVVRRWRDREFSRKWARVLAVSR